MAQDTQATEGEIDLVTLTFRPTRTRPYSRSLLDLVNDMFVPCTALEAVTCTDEATDAVGQRLIYELQAEGPRTAQDIQIRYDRAVWRQYLETLWNDAIRTFDLPLTKGKYWQDQRPQTVYVVLEEVAYRAWGGTNYTTYVPRHVYSYRQAAEGWASDYTIVETPLIGVEAFAQAS
jgi:hypothetical protein